MSEAALSFNCGGSPLVGILHRTSRPARRGVLIVVAAGPQYRVGGHRQLVLWARRLAAAGYPVFRFDYRGVGDSHGEFRGFDYVEDDIRAAVDRFQQECPALEEVVLWGECNAASAIMFYAPFDPRVRGAVLLNIWVRTTEIQAKALLRHYYISRIRERSFWLKLFSFRFNPMASLRSAVQLLINARGSAAGGPDRIAARADAPIPRSLPLPERVLAGFQRFNGQVMMVMSGRDIIAREFDTIVSGSDAWRAALAEKPMTRHDLPMADHTFSSAAQRDEVVGFAVAWLSSW